jgi:hypothetical protein
MNPAIMNPYFPMKYQLMHPWVHKVVKVVRLVILRLQASVIMGARPNTLDQINKRL